MLLEQLCRSYKDVNKRVEDAEDEIDLLDVTINGCTRECFYISQLASLCSHFFIVSATANAASPLLHYSC